MPFLAVETKSDDSSIFDNVRPLPGLAPTNRQQEGKDKANGDDKYIETSPSKVFLE